MRHPAGRTTSLPSLSLSLSTPAALILTPYLSLRFPTPNILGGAVMAVRRRRRRPPLVSSGVFFFFPFVDANFFTIFFPIPFILDTKVSTTLFGQLFFGCNNFFKTF